MAKVQRSVLKQYFQAGDMPTEVQFSLTLDSMVNFVDDRDFIGLRDYNATQDYLPGDTAVFDNKVVRCTTATTGVFDPADWMVLAAFGSVSYVGTWDTQNNVPPLASSVGTKGFYYVVVNASPNPNDNTSLNGIDDWGTGDWAIFNGSIWEKVDNSETPVEASNVEFTPTSAISATDVQAAIVEVNSDQTAAVDTKVSKAGDTMTGFLILNDNPVDTRGAVTKEYCDELYEEAEVEIAERVNRAGDTMSGELILATASPTPALAAVPKQYVDAAVDTKVSKTGDTMTGFLILNANPVDTRGAVTKEYCDDLYEEVEEEIYERVNRTGDTMSGELILASASPTPALAAVPKQYVDSAVAAVQGDVNTKVSKAGDTMTGELILAADPTNVLGAVTKQYVDAINSALTSAVNSKVNRSGDTLTGDLILNSDPTISLGAATKQYTDTGLNTKVNLAGSTMTGDLLLNANPSAALGAATKQYVDNGDSSLQSQVNAKVNRSGDTMTGDLILSADPTAALGATTKQYTDTGLNNKLNLTGGTLTGDLVLSANPSAALGAATKQYVDSVDASLQSQVNARVNRSGDTMTGDLILNADPTVALGAVTKQYIDAINAALTASINTKVSKAGDTMTGFLTLNADPTSALHASTKSYVDTNITAFAKKVVVPFTFDRDFATTSSDFVRIPMQVVIPATADVFPGTTLISARLYVDYLTETGSSVDAEGEAALTEWTASASGIPIEVSGSITSLTDSNDAWVKVLGPSFTLSSSKTYQIIMRRTVGSGGNPRVRIEAVSLILIYS